MVIRGEVESKGQRPAGEEGLNRRLRFGVKSAKDRTGIGKRLCWSGAPVGLCGPGLGLTLAGDFQPKVFRNALANLFREFFQSAAGAEEGDIFHHQRRRGCHRHQQPEKHG